MMAEETSTTPPTDPAGTGEGTTPPAATPPPTDPGAATDDDEVVEIKKSDLKKLQSQRDKNHDRLEKTEYQVAMMARDRDIEKFLNDPETKAKFPDVKDSDLLDAESAEDFEKLATQTQTRIDEATQRRLGELQRAEVPSITPEQKAEQLKKLKANPGSKSFQKMLELEENT